MNFSRPEPLLQCSKLKLICQPHWSLILVCNAYNAYSILQYRNQNNTCKGFAAKQKCTWFVICKAILRTTRQVAAEGQQCLPAAYQLLQHGTTVVSYVLTFQLQQTSRPQALALGYKHPMQACLSFAMSACESGGARQVLVLLQPRAGACR